MVCDNCGQLQRFLVFFFLGCVCVCSVRCRSGGMGGGSWEARDGGVLLFFSCLRVTGVMRM